MRSAGHLTELPMTLYHGHPVTSPTKPALTSGLEETHLTLNHFHGRKERYSCKTTYLLSSGQVIIEEIQLIFFL